MDVREEVTEGRKRWRSATGVEGMEGTPESETNVSALGAAGGDKHFFRHTIEEEGKKFRREQR